MAAEERRAASATGGRQAPAGHAEADPLELCARLWSLCTKTPYAHGITRNSPEFTSFINCKGLDTPRITPLFDVDFYSHQVSWQVPATNYLLHYCANSLEGPLAPHVVFDNDFLLKQIGQSHFHVPPLLHLIETADPALSPHPLFDSTYYMRAVGADFLGGELPIVAFIERWAAKPAGFSPYFSVPFYGMHEPIVRFGGLNPLIHFLSTPLERRRDPNPMLHRGWYLGTVEDEIGEQEPLVHYVLNGLARGLMPNPFASGELRETSLALPARVQALRQYISFPDQSATAWTRG